MIVEKIGTKPKVKFIQRGRKVTRVRYNWFYTHADGEEYQELEVGCNGVKSIEYVSPYGETRMAFRPYIEVKYDDGTKAMIFNFNEIIFSKKEERKSA